MFLNLHAAGYTTDISSVTLCFSVRSIVFCIGILLRFWSLQTKICRDCSMKVLITGASGLLGSDIAYTLENKKHTTIKLCKSPRPGYINADISSADGISTVESLDWDLIIHAAAIKDPEKCEKNKEESIRMNVEATFQLARAAKKRNAKMIYISTDYVFPGKNPPYAETTTPEPINVYGSTKLEGENKIASILENFCVLRVPILYGIRIGIEKSALLYTTLQALISGKPWNMEDSIVRYPTYTGDVAEAVSVLLEKNAKGIYHFSGQDKTTKYSITSIMADVLGLGMENIVRIPKQPDGEVKRPLDAHLSMDKIMALGVKYPLSFRDRIVKLRDEGFLKVTA